MALLGKRKQEGINGRPSHFGNILVGREVKGDLSVRWRLTGKLHALPFFTSRVQNN
jgi:hypothetical protein